jgi:carbamoyl-phosphate synthase small subunit
VIKTEYGGVAISHMSLNDDAVEGMLCLKQPVLSVQYHPEASPGPHDSAYVFTQFATLMENAHG